MVYQTDIPAAKTVAKKPAKPSQAKVVVSNDKIADAAANAAPAAKSNTGMPVEDLISIRKDHGVWTEGEYARSNAGLYSLLSRCLGAYQRMVGTHPQIKAFHAECQRVGLKFKKSSGVLQRIVSYVFMGAGSRRTSAYTRVLVRAHEAKIDPLQLHVWIASMGGIEEIRGNKATGLTAKQKQDANVAIATSAVSSAKILSVITDAKVDMSEASTPFVAALARAAADGSFEVVGIVTDDAVVDAVMSAYGEKFAKKKTADNRVADAESKTKALAAVAVA